VIEPEDGTGAEQHPDLASAGAQVIVAWCGPGEGPRGFAICPVVSVSGDAELYAALRDDFDVDGSGDPATIADTVWAEVRRVFDGALTAAESRGARDFYLRRLARTM
jgi:altronate dehydratase